MSRLTVLATVLLSLLWAPNAFGQSSQRPSPLLPERLDHVLFWTTDIDRLTSAFAVKLGFQVRPGGEFPDGVANRLVQFSNESFLELLYFTQPEGQLQGGALESFAFAKRATGANGFAFLVRDPDATRSLLSKRGFDLTPPSPASFDPDGPGPQKPVKSMWTTVGFKRSPIRASDIFFIRYNFDPLTPEQQSDADAFATHPNGAQRISAVWLLVEDALAEMNNLERTGIGMHVQPVRQSALKARGYSIQSAGEHILVLQPDGPGLASDALQARGPQIIGLRIETKSIRRAQRHVQRAYGAKVELYPTSGGEAFMAPTFDELGLILEFHSARKSNPLQK